MRVRALTLALVYASNTHNMHSRTHTLHTNTGLPPLPAGLVEGLSLQIDAEVPLMSAGFEQQQLCGQPTVAPPPFMRTRVPAFPSPPPLSAQQPRALPQQQQQQQLPQQQHAGDGLGGGGVYGAGGGGGSSDGLPGGAAFREEGSTGGGIFQIDGGGGASSSQDASGLSGGGIGTMPMGGQMGGGSMVFNLGGGGAARGYKWGHAGRRGEGGKPSQLEADWEAGTQSRAPLCLAVVVSKQG